VNARTTVGDGVRLGIIIPALNEDASIAQVVRRCRDNVPAGVLCRIVVGDNDSSDRTADTAEAAGAEVVRAAIRGYGSACLEAIRHLGDWPDVLVFVDGDGSSRPEELPRLLGPLIRGEVDLVLGSRPWDSGMTPPQRWGTWLAVGLLNLLWGTSYRDMGPFRGIRRARLRRLGMTDKTWGWTIEMQILAAERGVPTLELPVSWDRRIAGASKISGTVIGALRAGARILWTIGRYRATRATRIGRRGVGSEE
jgi:glycosyltransferase involved in cell wall biosynthesis